MEPSNSGDFPLVGRSLAVDFVNTEVVESGVRRELLGSTGDLLRWARAAGLDVPNRSLRSANTKVQPESARRLRVALRALFEARIDGRRPPRAALAELNRLLTAPRRGAAVALRGNRYVAQVAPVTTALQVLETVAQDARRILTGSDFWLLQRCANERCILLFVDRSRRSARRWCSMEVCGNRAKVQAHYRRAHDR